MDHLDELPKILLDLDDRQRFMVDSALCNDDVSSDEEVLENLIENGVPSEAAREAIKWRPRYLTDPIFQMFPTVLPPFNSEKGN